MPASLNQGLPEHSIVVTNQRGFYGVTRQGKLMREIFYLENDENDVLLLEVALRKVGCKDAARWFRRSSELKAALLSARADQQPKVIIVDLLLDGEYGLHIIQWLKEQPSLQHIPCFIFSSGRVLEEITAVLEQHATGYLFKPSKFEAWVELAGQLKDMIQSSLPVPVASVNAFPVFSHP